MCRFFSGGFYVKNDTINKIVRIKGNSMEPLLHDGDIAFVSAMDSYMLGDIVIFFYLIDGEKNILSHRIVYEDGSHFYCKGDNSLNLEEITSNAILGKIISVERQGKKIIVDIEKELIKGVCSLSKKCGDEWQSGNTQLAKVMAKRCYINMLKLCKSIEDKEKKANVCIN